jgi:predicted dinucleotide-binding enzyme
MNIGILGSGTVAQQMGIGLIKSSHKVKLGTRTQSKLDNWLKNVGSHASVGSFSDAAEYGEIILIATSWEGTENAINLAGKNKFKNKIVIDITNPLDFSNGVPPKFVGKLGNSAGEKIQSWLPDAKVVKAFNTVSSYIMINPILEEGDPDLLIAGNDLDAKKEVTEIAKGFGWKNIIDIGNISESFFLEAFAMLWIHFGFKYNHWTHAFKLLYK